MIKCNDLSTLLMKYSSTPPGLNKHLFEGALDSCLHSSHFDVRPPHCRLSGTPLTDCFCLCVNLLLRQDEKETGESTNQVPEQFVSDLVLKLIYLSGHNFIQLSQLFFGYSYTLSNLLLWDIHFISRTSLIGAETKHISLKRSFYQTMP